MEQQKPEPAIQQGYQAPGSRELFGSDVSEKITFSSKFQ
jgi:hypothetical protein